MTSNRDRAAGLLTHYMRTAWRAAGLDWDSDNTTEIEVLVDALEAMVRDQIREQAENATQRCDCDGSRCPLPAGYVPQPGGRSA